MKWSVETLNDIVDEELLALPMDMRARFLWIAELISNHGLEKVKQPYVKHIEGKLWEIRLKGKTGIARVIYVTAQAKRVVVRVFIKKTNKTPRDEINLSFKRAKEVQDNE